MNAATAAYLLDINVVLHTAAELVVPPDGMHTVPVDALKVRQREDRVLVRFDDGVHEQEIDYTGKALIVYHRNPLQSEDYDEVVKKEVAAALYLLWATQRDKTDALKDYSIGFLAMIVNDLHDASAGTPLVQWSRYRDNDHQRYLAARGVSAVIKKFGLYTDRKSKDQRRRRHVVWDHELIVDLWQRYGLAAEKERALLMVTYHEIQDRIAAYESELQI